MNAELKMVEFIRQLLDSTDEIGVARLDTFEEAGMLTHNEGLVLRLDDGSEFQITVVQSAGAEDDEEDEEEDVADEDEGIT